MIVKTLGIGVHLPRIGMKDMLKFRDSQPPTTFEAPFDIL
jgi:hypothetical protein